VGSYWPYATTVQDYINRAMPTLSKVRMPNRDGFTSDPRPDVKSERSDLNAP
jgi:hypothetical protein